MLARHDGARELLEEWSLILKRPIDSIVDVMTDPRLHARDLRQVTPFAGILTTAERSQVYAGFAHIEEQT